MVKAWHYRGGLLLNVLVIYYLLLREAFFMKCKIQGIQANMFLTIKVKEMLFILPLLKIKKPAQQAVRPAKSEIFRIWL